jgi:transposase
MVDRHGVPLAIRTAGANASDHRQIIPLILEFPEVGGQPGRPKELPDEAYADRGFDSQGIRELLRWLGIGPHIARRRTPHGSGLGKVRWVVERTISWLKGLRRLEKRCCRWLLMSRDREGSDDIRLTHEYLAMMLGARRESVTEALGPLQEAGLVESSRGVITILDGAALEARSCECYAVVRDRYEELLGG